MHWLEAHISPENMDRVVSYLTYHVAVWTFFLTLVVLFATALSIRSPLRGSALARKAEASARNAEAEERRIDRSLDYIRLACGFDLKGNRPSGGELQIVAIELLHAHPEYYPAYEALLNLWKSQPDIHNFVPATAALERLVGATKPVYERAKQFGASRQPRATMD